MSRYNSKDLLNPAFRARLNAMMADLDKTSKLGWFVFETWRKPVDTFHKSKVSKSDPRTYPSKHGYGWAADVLPSGGWGAKGAPQRKASWPGWSDLRAAAHKANLQNDIAWDRPHVDAPRSLITSTLQKALHVTADGKWGAKTDSAARDAAKARGIEWRSPTPSHSPKIHPATYTALYSALAGNTAPPAPVAQATAGKAIVAGASSAIIIIAAALLLVGKDK